MRLDRYIGEPAKFKVLRRQPDGSYKEMPPFDYFVLALKDRFTPSALLGYSNAARQHGDKELVADVERMTKEAEARSDRKYPD